MYSFRTHTIYNISRHFISVSQFININHIGGTFYRSTHCVIIIFTNKNNRQLPEHCEVKCFVEDTLAGGAIAKKTNSYIICALILLGKCHARTRTYLRTYYTMTTETAYILAKEVPTST